jgi:uncharacterized phiE125 gp8 family phage protein
VEKDKNAADKLYSLIPLADFKALLGIDDRDNKLSRFCLVTATHTIEQYCKRRLLRKTFQQLFKEWRDLTLYLNEYPVHEVLSVSAIGNMEAESTSSEIIEPDLYSIEPLDENENIPYQLNLSPALKRMRGIAAIKVIYVAGYSSGKAPPDLASACMELAFWNMSRYKAHRIGMTGNVRGGGKDGEHFEISMPENVQTLLEPYKRRVI